MSRIITRMLGYSAEEVSRWSEEIERENRRAARTLAVSLLPLSVINLMTQLIVAGDSVNLLKAFWLTAYALAMLAVSRPLVLGWKRPYAELLYLLEAPVLLLSILLGTFWDPQRQAITFLLFLTVLPVFMLDRPDRMALVLGIWSAAFAVASRLSKTDAVFYSDLLHVIEFYVASVSVYISLLRARLKSLANAELARFRLEHDRLTGCLRREALENRAASYLDQPILLFMCDDMGQHGLYREFFGQEASDEMSRAFAGTLTETFGREACYRYGGGEVLCVLEDLSLDEALEKIEVCRERLSSFRYQDRPVALSCALGYVAGTAHTEAELRDMVRLADIFSHQARRQGSNRSCGGDYDPTVLEENVRRSVLLGEASGYETNRLTGMPGMSHFIAQADELLRNVVDPARFPMVGYLKLLNLREFNNRYGYAQGDALIAGTARALEAAFSDHYLCHITAGQFALFCYREEAEAGIRRVAEALRDSGTGYRVQCKAGFAPYNGESAVALLDQATSALESIRGKKGVNVCFYDTQLDKELRFREYIVGHLDEALRQDWIKVYYQPIARAVTGRVCNEEALVRWDDPTYGFLQPFRFVPLLEEKGLLWKLDLYVVRQALRDSLYRMREGLPLVPVSVNLSRRDFEELDMVEAISALVKQSGLDPAVLKIEITESAFVTNQELLKGELRRFHSRGFDIWLDDFGSEYSTLHLLQELDFDLIKIDMKFTQNLHAGGKNYIIVSDIIDMAKRLGITTLIEGVETREQYRLLQQLGCEKIQGYLFNSPNPLSYIVRRAKSGEGLPFEDPASAAYYDAVGRVDLDEPMAERDDESGLARLDVMPAGVLELRGTEMACLRGSDSFLAKFRQCGLLGPDEGDLGIRPLLQTPPHLLEAAGRCLESEGWISFEGRDCDGVRMSIWLRRLSAERYRGGVALLTVLFPGSEEKKERKAE